MTLRLCPRCAERLPLSKFNYRDRSHTRLQSYCRECSNLSWRRWYSNDDNRTHHKGLVSDRRRRRIARHRAIVKEAKSVPCNDCGVTHPPYVMDFDHVGPKRGDISRLLFTVGTEALLAEIGICEVVCANCHRYRTHSRAKGR